MFFDSINDIIALKEQEHLSILKLVAKRKCYLDFIEINTVNIWQKTLFVARNIPFQEKYARAHQGDEFYNFQCHITPVNL